MAQVKVKAKIKEGYKQAITARAHSLIADASEPFGTKDSEFSPHELLLASLGACTSITLEIYAQKKGWDLQDVRVELEDEEIEDPNQPGRKIPHITRSISVSGNLTEEQVESLKAIADKCPIHKLLTGPKQIDTELKRLANV
jgi:putative redox protein